MNKYFFTLSISIFFLFSACSRKVATTKSSPNLKEFEVKNVNFDYLTTSSKIKFSNEDKNFSASANIRIKKDSVIWISVTPGFGIEVARGLITPDSLVFIDRLNKEYTAYNFKELSKKFNFDIDFNLVQAMLIGNMFKEVEPEDKVERELHYFVVRQEEGPLFIENFIGAQTLKLERVAIVEKESTGGFGTKVKYNTLNLSYSDFQALEEKIIPFGNLVSLDYHRNGQKKRTEINIQHKKASFENEALRFPFSIPEKYARK